MKKPENILIIRNDKLGDFMLAYPTFNVVKKLFPKAKIYTLVPEYTKPMAELCEWIDEVIIDDATNGLSGLIRTTSKLKSFNFDAALCLHSSPRIAMSLLLAGIPHRFAPASRLDQVLYNHRLTQRRSKSEKPESEYNIDLANFMGEYYLLAPAEADSPPFLTFPIELLEQYKTELCKKHLIEDKQKIIIVHAGTGGSAKNLSVKQYAELITHLSNNAKLFFILTAGPDETNIVKQLSLAIKDTNHAVINSTNGLKEFSILLASADLFISGSTGVLHIAGALNTATAAFYPRRKSATSLRWKTLNTKQKHIAFNIEEKDGSKEHIIDVNQISQTISESLSL